MLDADHLQYVAYVYRANNDSRLVLLLFYESILIVIYFIATILLPVWLESYILWFTALGLRIIHVPNGPIILHCKLLSEFDKYVKCYVINPKYSLFLLPCPV